MGSLLENIVSIRKAQGLSQDYIASKLDMSQGNYGKIERGELELKASHLVELSYILNIPVQSIIDYGKPEIESTDDRVEVSLKFKVAPAQRDEILKMLNVK
jgi:transcriptional regulator with XRE-family HTH domain